MKADTSCVKLNFVSLEDEPSNPLKFNACVRAGLSLGDEILDLKNLKSWCPHLKVIKTDVNDNLNVVIKIGQDVYPATRLIGFPASDNNLPWAAKHPIG